MNLDFLRFTDNHHTSNRQNKRTLLIFNCFIAVAAKAYPTNAVGYEQQLIYACSLIKNIKFGQATTLIKISSNVDDSTQIKTEHSSDKQCSLILCDITTDIQLQTAP